MAKKVEETINLDLGPMEDNFIPISSGSQQEVKTSNIQHRRAEDIGSDIVSCLRNEKITLRLIPKKTNDISNKKHVLYGGMSENAKRTYTVPMLRSGALVNVLTNAEKDFLEYEMGLEKNELSIHNKKNNFWKGYSVTLTKQDTTFDLSDPEDYIRYKVLLANKELICPSLKHYNEQRKMTYEYVVINDTDEVKATTNDMTISMEASVELGKILENKKTLKYVTEIVSGRPIAANSSLEFIQAQAFKEMQANPKLFSSVAKDSSLRTKITIADAVSAGIIRKKNDLYYLASTSEALCETNGEPTLDVAAKYLDSAKRQELRLIIEAKVKASID